MHKNSSNLLNSCAKPQDLILADNSNSGCAAVNKKRNHSTETANRQLMFGQQRNNAQNVALQQQQTFNSGTSAEQQFSAFKQQRPAFPNTHTSNFGYGAIDSKNTNGIQLESRTTASSSHHQNQQSPGTGEYQSILMTRFLKEPRLPPSSTYYNNSRKKKQTTLSRGSAKPNVSNGFALSGKTTATDSAVNDSSDQKSFHKDATNASQLNSGYNRRKRIGQPNFNGKNEISYRNQNEIMKKIFGNEQNYHQVKSLLGKGPYQQEEQSLLNKFQQLPTHAAGVGNLKSPKNQSLKQQENRALSLKPSSSPIVTKPRDSQGITNDRKQNANLQNLDKASATKQYFAQPKSPNVGPDEIILAKSIYKQPKQLEDTPTLKTERTPFLPHSSISLPQQVQHSTTNGNDQVEKAIFDLQEVKNNFLQEKNLFEQKIQQIQIKQNQTMCNGFGLMNATAYNKTATSGFLPQSAGAQRPLTQGGLILKNQQLMNDNNILKADLEQVTKEELRERLMVAEMVMKKLFQRNKDLEDLNQQVIERERSCQSALKQETQKTRADQRTGSISPHSDKDLENIDISAESSRRQSVSNQVPCKKCLEVNKEMTSREKELQERINELSQQLLKKTESQSKASHQEYLQMRLEETMTEAKRHFSNYIAVRNMYNSFLESRLNQSNIQGGVKGQKIHNDILNMLKKNLEEAELALIQERDQISVNTIQTQGLIQKKDQQIAKRDKKIRQLKDEIERRKFVETKVQRYVKGIISQNQKNIAFLKKISNMTQGEQKRKIDDYLRDIENQNGIVADEGGETTENEEEESEEHHIPRTDDDEMEEHRNISVEVNDL